MFKSLFGSNRRQVQDVSNLNLIPMMNLIVSIIPLLLISVTFVRFVAIETSLPVYSDEVVISGDINKSDLGLSVAITEEGFVINANNADIAANNNRNFIAKVSGNYDYEGLSKRLLEIKKNYPEQWSIVILPSEETIFGNIVATMDATRECKENSGQKILFPNVVIGGGVI